MVASIIPLHVLTGCDHNSGFYGVSKKLIADHLKNSKEAQHFQGACGTQLPVTQEVISDLEQFDIRYINQKQYPRRSESSKVESSEENKQHLTCA